MTSSDVTRTPVILVDSEDGVPENTAWVEVTTDVTSAQRAVAAMEEHLPLSDHPEEEEHCYECEGQQVWLTPEESEGEGQQWVPRDPTREAEDGARLFWIVSVNCKV